MAIWQRKNSSLHCTCSCQRRGSLWWVRVDGKSKGCLWRREREKRRVAVVPSGCSVVLLCPINHLGNRLNVGEERRAACTVLAVVRRRGHLWCGWVGKRKKEEGFGALLLGGIFFVFVLCMTRVNVIFTTNPTLLLNNTSAGVKLGFWSPSQFFCDYAWEGCDLAVTPKMPHINVASVVNCGKLIICYII